MTAKTMRPKIIAIAACMLAMGVGLLGVGELLSAPTHRVIGPPPSDIDAKRVDIVGSTGQSIIGWFERGKAGTGAVLLLHGIRSDRRQMLGRSKFLHAHGYSVLLIDLPAHGESDGERITFGYLEAEGVRTAMRFLEQTISGERIAVIGVSLGAAATVLSGTSPRAIVIESMYPTIDEALSDRLRLHAGSFGTLFAPLFLMQLRLKLGISPDQLRPIDRLSELHVPILIVAGTLDQHTTVAETKRLFEAANQPKEFWLVEGAAHVDLYRFDPIAYEHRILNFLARYL